MLHAWPNRGSTLDEVRQLSHLVADQGLPEFLDAIPRAFGVSVDLAESTLSEEKRPLQRGKFLHVVHGRQR